MTASPTEPTQYRTESGLLFLGVSEEIHESLMKTLSRDYGLTVPQIVEAASYSFAMVIRVALGLTGDRAKIAAVVSDTLSGWVTLAAVRHLANAGAECDLVFPHDDLSESEDLTLQLKPLRRMGIIEHRWTSSDDNETFHHLLGTRHAMLLGLYSPKWRENPFLENVIGIINDIQTPIHTVLAPLGIDVNTGVRINTPVFASSTLSLGVPLAGLSRASEFVGRHYLCDISVTCDVYRGEGEDLTPLFSEQPVIRIFSEKEQSVQGG